MSWPPTTRFFSSLYPGLGVRHSQVTWSAPARQDTDVVKSDMGPFSKNKECPLHSHRMVCLCATLVCSAALVLDVSVSHDFVDYWGTYVSAACIFVFFDAARCCKRPMERSFYCVCIAYCVIFGIQSTIPMSGAASRTCQLVRIALCAIGIALSGSILVWHFRHGSHGGNSATQPR